MKRLLALLFFPFIVTAQTDLSKYENIDVQHYKFNITLNDVNDEIEGEAAITVKFLDKSNEINFDLVDGVMREDAKGMTVTQVLSNNVDLDFSHKNELLTIDYAGKKNEEKTFVIKYKGIPLDGLIISKNKFGDRTFFGDNWPTRAHNWLPCVDHPSDKATVEFLITAPDNYQVVATGELIEESKVEEGTFYHWKTDVILPTKVMVIGAAEFAVHNCGEVHDIPVSSWVYPENRNEGFNDYEHAKEILDFFIERIAPYPYEKLANVQSKTKFGGMENAGNIFYFENSVTGKNKHDDLIAHEIVHQWFGNSASEKDWPHVWLSEGFATYLTDLYILHKYGDEAFKQRMDEERTKVIKFSKRQQTPVVDFETKNLLYLLNPNSYEKGGWVLHMLRNKLGDKMFWECIQSYYDNYKLSNADTKDFIKLTQLVSDTFLEDFFNQWLYTAGHPILKSEWEQSSKNQIEFKLIQTQKQKAFEFPLSIKLVYEDGSTDIRKVNVDNKEQSFNIAVDKKVKSVELDPNVELLFENAK